MDREKEEAQAERKQSLRNEDENGQREGTESIGGRSRGTRDTGIARKARKGVNLQVSRFESESQMLVFLTNNDWSHM